MEASSREAGAAAELASSNKLVILVKYAGLSSQGEFIYGCGSASETTCIASGGASHSHTPIAVESRSPVDRDALQCIKRVL